VPGCKVDTVPILEGPQGSRKSTAIKTLFEPWFSDELADLGSKDSAMQARGVWGLEVSELDAMSRGEVSRIKAFISRTTDRFRPPYGSRIIESPRACVFWGTTNVDGYLKDESGGRRFWPVKVGKIDIDGLREARDQLWAEAQVLFDANVPWWLVKDDHVRAAEEQQLDRYGGDPWDDAISRYVAGETEVSIEKVLRDGLGLEISRTGQTEMNRVVRSLRALGFNRVQVRRGDKRVRVYRKPMTASDTCDDFPGDRPMASNVTTLRTGDTFGPVTQEVPAAQALSPLSQQSPRF
jgi:predicted P-loop ATPase